MEFLRQLWRMINGLCVDCGGKLNCVYGMGPRYARRADGTYVWCPRCSRPITDDEWDD